MADRKPNKLTPEKPIQNGPFKVFFIASNQSSLDDKLNYSLKKGEKANFQKVVANTTKFKREEFSVYVFCFDIIKEELREVDRDKEKKLYKAIIKLNKKKKLLKGSNYEGKIFFKETQNNFIYDFEFEEEKGFIGNSQPPLAVKFTKTEQLKLFNLALTKLKIKQNHKPSIDLIVTTQKFLVGQKYTIDLYLQIMKSSFSQKQVLILLRTFNFKKLMLPPYQFELKDYKSFLTSLENNPKIVTKHCLEKDNPENFNKIIYSFLLYYKVNYEKENVKNFLLKKDLWKYFIDILPNNYEYFQTIEIPEELIKQMIEQKNLTFKIINGTLFNE